ncbi:hypothetical protein CALVIDRAFT_543164 [Calocera viscosa TUFC12733]|uniref:DUF7918 domain-containing protein n=1 Tax=Calocera viscosa (strain TUFC12733) TaxID=1330018 RepID=A0A167FVI3_CALVF|nr:hypothetical protein CALVIDRAFT_543164 [Calocera viscosa TUFC12733]
MPRLGDYEIWVEVDGVRLAEYAIESRAGNVDMRCWIPSEEGKNFIIHYKQHGEGRTCFWKLDVDGRKCGGSITQPRHRHTYETGVSISSSEEQFFQFGRITLTENDQIALQDEALIKQLGTLQIVIQDGTTLRVRNTVPRGKRALLKQKPVHEQSKKAAGHCVVGGAIVQRAPTYYSFKCFGRKRKTFVFQYGPKELLQAKGIMPPPPRAIEAEELVDDKADRDTPDGREESSEEDSEEERAAEARIRELKEELEALNNRGKRKGKKDVVKREDAERPRERMKMEEIEPNRTFALGEVIDLT